MKKIHVLIVAENLSYGGAQKMMTFLANNLDRAIFEVSVLNETSNIPPVRSFNDDVNMYGHPPFTQRGIKRIKEILYLNKLIKKIKPDVLISFLDMPNFITTVSGMLTGVPVIISERGDPSQKRGKTYEFLWKFEKRVSGAVFQTEGAKKYYPEEIQKKSVVIANPVVPVELSREYSYSGEIKKIAYVGRFENVQKRQDIAIETIKKLKTKIPDIVLNFYGNGPDEDMIKTMAEEQGVLDNVVFHGKTSDVSEKLLDNDMFLLTSDYEGIPNTLIEAMAVGMPCVSTDCSPGGAALLLKNEVNGLLVPAGNSNAIVEAILKFSSDKDLTRKCGENAKKIVDHFSPTEIIKQWNSYIISVVNKKGKV